MINWRRFAVERRRRDGARAGLVVATMALLILGPLHAEAQQAPAQPSPADEYSIALNRVTSPFEEHRHISTPCARVTRAYTYSVFGAGINFVCPDQSEHLVRFSEFPVARKDCGLAGGCELVVSTSAAAGSPNSAALRLFIDGRARAQEWADAWTALSSMTPNADPATDAAFQQLLQTARADGRDNTEEERRAQIQVEAMIQAGQLRDAARIYRQLLEGPAPDWAPGHYNLALVYGELSFYPEAIVEMRRYLYLAPNAPDARAAQDQIYRWEAAMAAPRGGQR